MNRGSLDLMRELKQRARAGSDLNLMQKSGCLDFCEQGPTCVVYPEGVWYSLKDKAALELSSNTLSREQSTNKQPSNWNDQSFTGRVAPQA